jgi:hypothetical protein
MSYDFATAKLCSHEVFFEALQLGLDNQTAQFVQPPSSKRVEVYVNRQKVPNIGLYSYASIATTEIGPYRIKSGVNDLLDVNIQFGETRRIQLIPGTISANDMAQYLRSKLPELDISVSAKRIVFSSRTRVNGTEFFFPDPRWTDRTQSLTATLQILGACRELGIIPGRHVTGQQLYPGWTVQEDPMSPDEGKLLFFNSSLRNNSPLIQVNYVTQAVNCRRCHGTGLEFDYTVKDGTYETVKDTDLLAQEFDKFLFTISGTHWKWPWLGSQLAARIGGKGDAGKTTVNALLSADVSQAFNTYQNIKQLQDTRFPQQQVSDAEYPLALNSLNVRIDPNDPTVAIINAVINSRSDQFIPIEREINPNPLQLTGSKQTFLFRS